VGRVAKTEADTGSTAASAIAADIDARSKADLEQPSRCDATLKNDDGSTSLTNVFGTAPGGHEALDGTVGPVSRWNRDPAVCSSSAGEEPKAGAPDDHGSAPLGSSGVTCAVPDGDDVVAAEAAASLTGQALTVGRSSSWTEIRREERGIVSTAHALAGDITIGGVIRIAEIRSSATSVANGRPNDAPMSQHAVSISGLRIGDDVICVGECDLQQAVEALNLVAAGRVQFRIGHASADQELREGSPGGALTAVQKSPLRRFSDRALAGDDTSEVPALEMVRYNDNFPWGAARQVFQLAGVATSASYNVLLLPELSGGAPGASAGAAGGTAPGGPGDAGVAGTPGTQGTPGTPATSVALTGAGAGTQQPASAGGVAGRVGDVLGALGRGLRVFWGDPRQALLLFTAWLLLAQPLLLARRRRLLQRVQWL
jgi:hypothetical protein